jgi:hypothetical protein
VIDWSPTETQLEYAVAKTAELRSGKRPQWREAGEKLEASGVAVEDAVVAEWHEAGQHAMLGIIASRDRRVFHFGVTYDFDESGRPLEKGVGWIDRWDEVPQDEIKLTSGGMPNSWAQAAAIGRLVLEGM